LEVLDWGGTGSPLIFLPGLGNTAHVFDEFAPHFTAKHHVYAISRRGTGASSMAPPTDENYNADQLGDDVVAVMNGLHIDKAFLAGHSIGGQELSSVGTRHPEKVLGLIYLDATYNFAFYNSNGDTLTVDVDVVRRDLTQLPKAGVSPIRSRALIKEMLETLPDLEKALNHYQQVLEGLPEYPPIAQTPERAVMDAIDGGSRRYGPVLVPVLAIIAAPPPCQPNCDTPSAKAYADGIIAQADAYEAGNPKAKIVRLSHADHYVFRSNEPEVERDMNDFMDGQ
jgi:pimeloyl-ACP methyl ester carboxylesterase